MDTDVVGIQKLSIFTRGVVEVANFAPFPYYGLRLEELRNDASPLSEMSKVVFWKVRIDIMAESIAAPGKFIECAKMWWTHDATKYRQPLVELCYEDIIITIRRPSFSSYIQRGSSLGHAGRGAHLPSATAFPSLKRRQYNITFRRRPSL